MAAGERHSGEPIEVPDGNLAEWFEERVAEYGDGTAALVREGEEYREISYDKLYEEAQTAGAGLLDLGLEPGDRVAIRSETRYEWSVVDLGCILAGLILVPVYPTFTTDQARYVLEDVGASVLVDEDADGVESEVSEVVDEVSDIDDLPTGERDAMPGFDRGHEDTTTVIYTSGTTGRPKGCKLTNRNILATMEILATHYEVPDWAEVGTAFLPLSHAYQRLGNYNAWNRGVGVAFMHIETLADELEMVEPSVVAAVPRLWERIHDRIRQEAEAAGGVKLRLFEWAYEVAVEYGRAISDGGSPSPVLRAKHAVADRLVLSSIREETGLTRVAFSNTGGASIDPELLYFYLGAGIPLLEGYGATEVTTPAAITGRDRIRPGTVGPPAPGVDIKIDDTGEILVRGPNVFDGYWDNDAATEKAMDGEWYRTGDVGHFDDAGFLIVEGRIDAVEILDTGKNVRPETIEDALVRSQWVAGAMAVAQDRKFVSALLQPNYGAIVDFADREGIDYDESAVERDETDEITAVLQDLLEHEAVQELFADAVATANEGLSKYERITAYSVLNRAFSVEREELTPTLKKRRGTIKESFRDRIEAMYGEGEATIDATLTQDAPQEQATRESQETATQD